MHHKVRSQRIPIMTSTAGFSEKPLHPHLVEPIIFVFEWKPNSAIAEHVVDLWLALKEPVVLLGTLAQQP